MPALDNSTHERFCVLIAEFGDTPGAAYARLAPQAKNKETYAATLLKRPEVAARLAELREEISTRGLTTLSRKREILRLMIEGVIPTKVVNKANGTEETYDKLLALQFDAKLAGELADNVNVTSSELKLNFSVRDRDSDILDGEGIMDAVIVPQAALENGA